MTPTWAVFCVGVLGSRVVASFLFSSFLFLCKTLDKGTERRSWTREPNDGQLAAVEEPGGVGSERCRGQSEGGFRDEGAQVESAPFWHGLPTKGGCA